MAVVAKYVVTNGRHDLIWDVKSTFRDCGMRCCAVVAMVFNACHQKNQLTFPRSEGSLVINGMQREIALESCWVVRKDGHQVRDEAERLLNVLKDQPGSLRGV